MTKYRLGFSLIELLVVISIIGILSAVLYLNVNQGSAQARDAQRQADLRNLETALELYKNEYGRYPERCANSQPWSGQSNTQYACASGNQYIVGLAPEFIPTLPTDPKLNGTDSGYVYTTNSEGSVYKLMTRKTVETEIVTYDHVFKSCDTDNTASTVPLCNTVHPSNNKPSHCRSNDPIFQTTYAVWGGYAIPTANPGTVVYENQLERLTEDIVCEIP